MKHQSSCYRNIAGKKYTNFADMIYGEEENTKVFAQAKAIGKSIRRIKHPEGYYQLFVEV